MPRKSDTPGHESTGAKPYAPRPGRKSAAASKARAPKRESSSALAESAANLDPSRRSTVEERRAVIVESLRLASAMAEDPSMPPSARASALQQARQLVAALQAEDLSDPSPASSWASLRPQAS